MLNYCKIRNIIFTFTILDKGKMYFIFAFIFISYSLQQLCALVLRMKEHLYSNLSSLGFLFPQSYHIKAEI